MVFTTLTDFYSMPVKHNIFHTCFLILLKKTTSLQQPPSTTPFNNLPPQPFQEPPSTTSLNNHPHLVGAWVRATCLFVPFSSRGPSLVFWNSEIVFSSLPGHSVLTVHHLNDLVASSKRSFRTDFHRKHASYCG